MHEVFLQRMAAHPVLRTDVNFKVFLEYDQEVTFIKSILSVLAQFAKFYLYLIPVLFKPSFWLIGKAFAHFLQDS